MDWNIFSVFKGIERYRFKYREGDVDYREIEVDILFMKFDGEEGLCDFCLNEERWSLGRDKKVFIIETKTYNKEGEELKIHPKVMITIKKIANFLLLGDWNVCQKTSCQNDYQDILGFLDLKYNLI